MSTGEKAFILFIFGLIALVTIMFSYQLSLDKDIAIEAIHGGYIQKMETNGVKIWIKPV